jgi:hypothetical protein
LPIDPLGPLLKRDLLSRTLGRMRPVVIGFEGDGVLGGRHSDLLIQACRRTDRPAYGHGRIHGQATVMLASRKAIAEQPLDVLDL